MQLREIEEHWKGWAQQFDVDLRATTKTRTIKELEIAEFCRVFQQAQQHTHAPTKALEVGCGNGHNCFGLFHQLPHFMFTGIDFIPEMIVNANKIKDSNEQYDSLSFFEGNILKLDAHPKLENEYDIVFTDRCIINLNTIELQKQALDQLIAKTVIGGTIALIENVKQTYDQQNELRNAAGLAQRTPDKFNLFIDEPPFLEHAQRHLTLLECKDFASLHDIVLYVLAPMINDGKVDYEHPMVAAATKLLLANESNLSGRFGSFGQNRLYVFKREQ